MERRRSNSCGSKLPITTDYSEPFLDYIEKLKQCCSDHQFPEPRFLQMQRFGFECNCSAFKTEGFGSSKSNAKHEAAKNMLLLFNEKHLTQPNSNIYASIGDESEICNNNVVKTSEIIVKTEQSDLDATHLNYIGKIIEWCSRHKCPQPRFIEVSMASNAGFQIICRIFEYETKGSGFNKKAAKQDAAKKMFSLIKDRKVTFTTALQSNIKNEDMSLDTSVDHTEIKKEDSIVHLPSDCVGEDTSVLNDVSVGRLPITTNSPVPFVNHIGHLNTFCYDHKLPLPKYTEMTLFGFTCNLTTFQTQGLGATMSVAKQDAAKKMLDLIRDKQIAQPVAGKRISISDASVEKNSNVMEQDTGNGVQNDQSFPGQIINYVGKVNELCAGHKYLPPIYTEQPTDNMSVFCMTCRVLEHETQGFGSTKKAAKQEAAKNLFALIKDKNMFCASPPKLAKTEDMNSINCSEENSVQNNVSVSLLNTTNPSGFVNHVGKLNEFCSGKKLASASYTDILMLSNTQFGITCTFSDFQTQGYGSNKKVAKQEAAKKMLMLVLDKSTARTSSPFPTQLDTQLDGSIEIKKEADTLLDENSVVEDTQN